MGAPLHDDPPVISACPSNIYEKYERVCRQLHEAEVKIRILEGQIDSFKQAFGQNLHPLHQQIQPKAIDDDLSNR